MIDTIELPKTAETGVANKWLAPDRFYAVVTRGGATFKSGFDGEAGWVSSPQLGLKTLNGKDLVLPRRTAVFPREIRFRELASQIPLKGKAQVNLLHARGQVVAFTLGSDSGLLGNGWTPLARFIMERHHSQSIPMCKCLLCDPVGT